MSPAIEVLRDLGTRLDDLEDEASDLLGTTGIPALAVLLDEVRSVRQALGLRERAIEDLLTDVMFEDTMEVPGLGVVQRRQGKDRKGWDSEGLLSTVIRRSLDPEQTGELPDLPEAVERIRIGVLAAAPLTASTGWRVTALKALDLDPDEWCTTSPGRASVQITKADA